MPFVVLVVVAGTAWLTGGRDPASGATDGALPSSTPSASPAAVGVTTASPSPAEPVDDATFPARALGLPVRSVADVLARRVAGALGDEVVAVAGHLTVLPGRGACLSIDDAPTISTAAPCGAVAVLAASQEPVVARSEDGVVWRTARDGAVGVHLDATAFPTTDLAALSGGPAVARPRVADNAGIAAVATIVIGRFGDPRVADPRSNDRHPNLAFVIERVAWLDGAWQARAATRYVELPAGWIAIERIRVSAASAFPGGAAVISLVFVDLDTLGHVDAVALGTARSGAANLGLDEPSGVWYLRVMRREGGSEPPLARDAVPWRLGWVVVGADGTVLGSAIDG